ncbi:YcnI family protein [Nocardia gipuzkoensis]|uniref:YcnI family copper-binding membrane protein n=1 Tax=Nocardia TaxID=1817 RepID=UPI001E5A3880|nr:MULTISPECIES: YcnI family protein [Nocardia]UGT70957.1 YcnI family protein [Nocardia gipuzkoensis]
MHTALRRLLLATGVATAATVLAGGAASAHLDVEAPTAKQGSTSIISFRISNESDHASTISLKVELPGLKTARTEPMAGWTALVERDLAKKATSVTWTANPGVGVGPGQFERFFLYGGPLPKQDKVAFRAIQTYSDGKIETWEQPAPDGAPEPEYPLPVLSLAAGEDEHAHGTEQTALSEPDHDDSGDPVARWLGGAGLLLGLLGAGAGVGALARRRQA